MQWISLIASFIFGKLNSRPPSFKESAFAIFEEVTFKSRKAITLILGAAACVLILCGGLFMSLVDLTTQYDREGLIRFTASFGTGLSLVVLSLGVFVWIFKFAWPGARDRREVREEAPAHTHRGGPLEQALATLVMDFVKERELRREERESPLAPSPAATAASRPAAESIPNYQH